MKRILSLIAIFFFTTAAAQEFPNRAVRIVVPFPPSGPVDVVGRIIGERLSAKWKVPVVVENRPGAGTVIGTDNVAKSPADGYTMLFAVTAHAVNATLVRQLPYDTVKDFAPVVLVATAPNILAVNPGLPVKTTQELIAHAKANPGKLNAGTHGIGNTSHLAAEMLKSATGIDFTIVHYKGAQPAATALMSGEISFMFDTGVVIPHAQAGRVRIIGNAGPKRSRIMPDVPTLIESGLSGFEVVSWYGMFAPAATPVAALDVLNKGVNDALADTEVRARIAKLNLDVAGGTRDELNTMVRDQIDRWARVIKSANIQQP